MFYQETLLVYHPKLSKRLITWTPGRFQCGRAVTITDYRRERKERENMQALAACIHKLSDIGSFASFHWLKVANCISSVGAKPGGKGGNYWKQCRQQLFPFKKVNSPTRVSSNPALSVCPRSCLSKGRKCGLICSLESHHCTRKPFQSPESQLWVYLNRKINTHAQNGNIFEDCGQLPSHYPRGLES